ncbi:MAG: 4Fe-4S dicluster domain-containing protein [Lachnospiraceae bacterium]|nr:4Fe-4S dicluster domain-containing protein [Lachnospiraceae bacterium]
MVGKISLFEKKEDCCGCYACYSICPCNAIIMCADDFGFEYPNIDSRKCVECEKCIKVCPIKNQRKSNMIS